MTTSYRPATAALAMALLGVSSPITSFAADGARTIEEIVVTARKREENIQDVGLSVSALGAQEIENNFARDIRDLVFVSPNLVLDDTAQGPGGVAAAYIRGIGVSEVEKNFDPAVGVVVDGIFLGTMTGGITQALDLESVEVLRGPQGTLFGRNTIGGVINLKRSQPTGELGGKIRASLGNYDTTRVEGLLNFGIGEQVAVKLTGAWDDQGEGFYDNINTGRDEGRIEYQSFGVNAVYAATDTLELEYTAQIERTDQDTPPLLNVGQPGQLFCDAFGFCSPDLNTPISGDRWKTAQDVVGPNDATFDADTHILEVRWDINDSLRLDYIFGSWETEETVLTDFDAAPPVLFHTSRPAEYEQQTHELRLTWDGDGPVRGTAGLYLWDSEYEIRLRSFIGFAVPNTILDLPQTSAQESESYALFFEGDYDLTDQLTLTVGGRYTKDEKSTAQSGIVTASADDDWAEFLPKIGIRYAIDDNLMVYGTYSEGYRAGGFNGRVDSVETATTPYDQETVENFEIGFKTEWLDNTLRVNGALFYMDYGDKQEELQLPSATSGTGQVTLVANASTARMQGLELDVLYYPTDALSLRLNAGYLDAEYKDFEFTNAGGLQDLSNLDIRRAPDLTASGNATYEWTLNNGRVWALVGWHYIGEHEVDFANKPEVSNDAQHLINASVNYEINNVQVSLFGHNLTEEDGYGIGFDVAGLWTYAATRAPRTYGLEVSYSFGE
ncbi:MAG: TonB-dependent receptor [Pseudomonadales bacterium]